MASEPQQQTDPPNGASNGRAALTGRDQPLVVAGREPSGATSFGIVRTSASAEVGGVVARFALDGQPHPAWQGAFARALEGTLGDMSGRWRFDGSRIAVTRVRTGRAGDVAEAVCAAVASANDYLADRADEQAAVLAAAVAADVDLRRDATDAAAAMRAALGV